MPSPPTYWGLPNTYQDASTVSSSGLNAQANISTAQTVTGLQFQGPGVYPWPDLTSFKVTHVSGDTYSIAQGAGISQSTAYGWTALLLPAASAPATIALPSGTWYIFAQVWVQAGVNDSRSNLLPQFVYSASPTLDGGIPLAVVVSGSAPTDIRDMRLTVNWNGDYSANVTYGVGDLVANSSNLWLSVSNNNIGNTPTEGANWTEFSAADGSVINWKDAYNPATSYVPNDAVSDGGSSYICILATTGNEPPNATYWGILAQGGTNGAGYAATSTTPLTIATGAQTFTIQAGLAYIATANIIIVDSADATKYMIGTVTSYDPSTGIMVANVTAIAGSGTISTWNVSLTGAPGPAGAPGGSLNPTGQWVTGTAYNVNDAVFDGTPASSYWCILTHVSSSMTEPGVGGSWQTYWTILAQAGATGSNGATGATGATGAQGLTGATGATNLLGIFAATADVTVTNTTTPTSLVGTVDGSKTIPANILGAGTTIRGSLALYLTSGLTPTAFTIDIKLGSTVIISTGSITPAISLTNEPVALTYELTCRGTGSSNFVGFGELSYGDGTIAAQNFPLTGTAQTVTVTATQVLDAIITYGGTSTSDSANCYINSATIDSPGTVPSSGNATKVQNVPFASASPASGQIWEYNSGTGMWTPADQDGSGNITINVAGGSDVILTNAQAVNGNINLVGVLTGNINLIVPAVFHEASYHNSTTGAFGITVKTSAGTGVPLLQGTIGNLICDGTNVAQLSYLISDVMTFLTSAGLTTVNIDSASGQINLRQKMGVRRSTATAADGANVSLLRSRGSLGSESAIDSGDTLSSILGFGYGTTGYAASGDAGVRVYATENFSDTAHGCKLVIATTPNGTAVIKEFWAVDQNGTMEILNGSGTVMASVDITGLGSFSLLQMKVETTPANPPSGSLKLYFKSDGNLYSLNSSGTETEIAGGGGGSGTVTSVAVTVPSDQTVSGSPITTSGTLAITDNTQSANTVKAGPVSGSAAVPGYRALVAGDLPATAVTPGAYTSANITVDQEGRITAAADGPVAPAVPPVAQQVTLTATDALVPAVWNSATIPLGATAAIAQTAIRASGGAGDADSVVTGSVTVNGKTYVTNFYASTVSVLDASLSLITSIATGAQPIAAALTPDGTELWVVNTTDGTISVINTGSDTVTHTITVGAGANRIAITPDGTKAFVPNNGANTVSVVTVSTHTVAATVTVGTAPYDVAITPDGATAYVTNSGDGTVTPITVSSNSPGSPITVISNPSCIAITPDGSKAYVGSGTTSANGSIIAIPANTASGVTIGQSMGAMAITPDGTQLFAASAGSNLLVNITIPGNVVTTLSLPHVIGGVGAQGVAISPDGVTCFVDQNGLSGPDGEISSVDIATFTANSPISITGAHGTCGIVLAWSGNGSYLVDRTLADGNATPPTVTGAGYTDSITTPYSAGEAGTVTAIQELNLSSMESAASSSTAGTVTHKFPVYNASGVLLGYGHLYDS